jgi:hypothetical protein
VARSLALGRHGFAALAVVVFHDAEVFRIVDQTSMAAGEAP